MKNALCQTPSAIYFGAITRHAKPLVTVVMEQFSYFTSTDDLVARSPRETMKEFQVFKDYLNLIKVLSGQASKPVSDRFERIEEDRSSRGNDSLTEQNRAFIEEFQTMLSKSIQHSPTVCIVQIPMKKKQNLPMQR